MSVLFLISEFKVFIVVFKLILSDACLLTVVCKLTIFCLSVDISFVKLFHLLNYLFDYCNC